MFTIDSFLQALALVGYAAVAFSVCWTISLIRGRQTLANLMIAGTLAWPVWLLASRSSAEHTEWFANPWFSTSLYLCVVIICSILSFRIMPEEFSEKTFESAGKKFLIAIGATALVLTTTFHVLGLGNVIPGGIAVAPFFETDARALGWLLFSYGTLYAAL